MQFSSDVGYWSKNAFKHEFQHANTFFQLGGEDVNVYGGGTIDGNGGAWKDKSTRPVLFGTIGLNGGTIANLNLRNSPQWFNLVKDSKNVVTMPGVLAQRLEQCLNCACRSSPISG